MVFVITEGRRDRGISDPTQIEISKFAIQSHGNTRLFYSYHLRGPLGSNMKPH